jgi:Raf kinase inhibitor-like YbhB/YbcL family protein
LSPRAAPLALAVALAAGLLACSDDGRELQPPSADQTTTLPTLPSTSSTQPAPAVMTLEPREFTVNGAIPGLFSCDGINTSPPLAWTGVPEAATELVVVVNDPDAGGFVHWVIAGLDPGSTGIDAGAVPEGAVQATNDGGSVGWTGPCPPAGQTHDYVFTLYALAEPLGLQPGLAGREAADLARAAAIATSTFTANFTRPSS